MSLQQDSVHRRLASLSEALLAGRARPLRFAIVGGTAGLVQLCVLGALVSMGLQPFPANAVAFVLAAQVNFLLSQTFTWRDRHPDEDGRASLVRRWPTFNACISGAAAVNLSVFALALHFVPHLPAAALGIVAGASLNFISNDRLTFGRTAKVRQRAPADASDLAPVLVVGPLFEEPPAR